MRVRWLCLLGIVAVTSGPAWAAGRSGTYTLTVPVSYSCVDTFIGSTIFSGSASALVITDAEPSITISEPGPAPGEPGSLSGTLSDPTFSAQKIAPGGCAITQRISGSFSNVTTMQATYAVSFSGPACAQTTCINRSLPFVATRPAPTPVPSLPTSMLIVLGTGLGALAMRAFRSVPHSGCSGTHGDKW